MQITNSSTAYGLVSKALHWSVALLVAFQFAGGIAGIEDDAHATAGVTVLVLMPARLLWRWLVPLPDWAPNLSSTEKRVMSVYERTLYAMLFAKPLTGLLLMGADDDDVKLLGSIKLPSLFPESDYFEDLFSSLHFWSGVILLAALAVHLFVVFRHQVLLRDGMLYRMLGRF